MVRSGNIEDLSDVITMLEACKAEMNERGLHFWNDTYPTVEMIEEDLNSGNSIVYELDGKIVAFLSMYPNRPDKYEEYYNVHENYVYVQRVMSHPNYRRHGHAYDILKRVEELGYKSIRLLTRNTNVYSVRLYTKLGYKVVRTEARDSVLMQNCEKVL